MCLTDNFTNACKRMTEREEKERRGSGAENEMGGRRGGLRGWVGGQRVEGINE